MTAVKISCRRNFSFMSLQIGLIALVFVGFASRPLLGQASARTLIRAGHLLDVTTGTEPAGQTIIVVGDKIAGITPTASTPAGPDDKVIDLSGLTVLPGLIDVHTHLTHATNFDPFFTVTMTPAKEAIIGVENAKVTLEAGFTTVRNVGAYNFTDVALRDEIDAGHIPRPHMQVSGLALGITGGHLPPLYEQKMKIVSAVEKDNARHAIAAGVKVALGTDASVYPHGLNAHEIDVYVNQFGMTPLQGIKTGTVNAADLMGWSDKVGSITVGKWADIIAVDGDPLKDVRNLQRVSFVMKGGVVYKYAIAKP